MMRSIIFAAALVATTTFASAQRAEPDFSADRFKAHVAFLADDLLEGREAGTRGHEIAARYIAGQFALLGVKPGGDDGAYFKRVEFVEAARTGPAPTLVLTTPKGRQSLAHGKTAMIRGPISGGAVKASAPLVFVGYGMQDAVVGYDDYAGLDVRGKIVVVLYGSPKGMDSEIGAHLQSEQARKKQSAARARPRKQEGRRASRRPAPRPRCGAEWVRRGSEPRGLPALKPCSRKQKSKASRRD